MATMVVTEEESCFLEILIPTFNRSSQLQRLLSILEQETASVLSVVKIRITVSDNCSTDETQLMLSRHSFGDRIVVRRNDSNLGALRNIWDLYETTRADYAWVISDDDIPKPNSLRTVIDVLLRSMPTVFTFEFEQPPVASPKRHGNRDGIEELTDLREALPHVLALGKLTKQVFCAQHLQTALRNVNYSRDTGYGWLLVILEVIHLASSPKIVIGHDFLAGCDADYAQITDGLTPQFWDDYLLLLGHETVKLNCPSYAQAYRYGHYKFMVEVIYAVLAGEVRCADDRIFKERGKILPFHRSYFRNPFVFLQWVSLRLGISASPAICRITSRYARIGRGFLSRFGIKSHC